MRTRGLLDSSRSGRPVAEPQRDWWPLGLTETCDVFAHGHPGWVLCGSSLIALSWLCWPWSGQIISLSFPGDRSKARWKFRWKLRGSKREKSNRIRKAFPYANTSQVFASTQPSTQLHPTPSTRTSWFSLLPRVHSQSSVGWGQTVFIPLSSPPYSTSSQPICGPWVSTTPGPTLGEKRKKTLPFLLKSAFWTSIPPSFTWPTCVLPPPTASPNPVLSGLVCLVH